MSYCFKTGKLSYETRNEANGAALRVKRRRRSFQTIEVYRCRFCKNFHLGRAT